MVAYETMRSSLLLLLIACNGVWLMDTNVTNCPEKCLCRRISDTSLGLKVKCGGMPQIKMTSVKDVDFAPIKVDVVHL